jgi:hypothetical protein
MSDEVGALVLGRDVDWPPRERPEIPALVVPPELAASRLKHAGPPTSAGISDLSHGYR